MCDVQIHVQAEDSDPYPYTLSVFQHQRLLRAANSPFPAVGFTVLVFADEPDDRLWFHFCIDEMLDLVALGLFKEVTSHVPCPVAWAEYDGPQQGRSNRLFFITGTGFEMFHALADSPPN